MEKKTVWIVVAVTYVGSRQVLSAWFDEEKARYSASRAVGVENGYIGLETLEVSE